MSKSTTIKREEVLKSFNLTTKRIKSIEEKEPHVYATVNKYLPGIGAIHELQSINEAVKANKYINKNSADFDTNAQELGLDAEDLEENLIQGFSPKVWKKDIVARINEIKDEQEMDKLKKAKKVLKKHLSEDDIFEMEMATIGGTLGKLFDMDDLENLELTPEAPVE